MGQRHKYPHLAPSDSNMDVLSSDDEVSEWDRQAARRKAIILYIVSLSCANAGYFMQSQQTMNFALQAQAIAAMQGIQTTAREAIRAELHIRTFPERPISLTREERRQRRLGKTHARCSQKSQAPIFEWEAGRYNYEVSL